MVNLHEIERGIGIDLMRRPVLTATLNAWLLRLFADAFLQPDEDEDDDDGDGVKKMASQQQADVRHLHRGARGAAGGLCRERGVGGDCAGAGRVRAAVPAVHVLREEDDSVPVPRGAESAAADAETVGVRRDGGDGGERGRVADARHARAAAAGAVREQQHGGTVGDGLGGDGGGEQAAGGGAVPAGQRADRAGPRVAQGRDREHQLQAGGGVHARERARCGQCDSVGGQARGVGPAVRGAEHGQPGAGGEEHGAVCGGVRGVRARAAAVQRQARVDLRGGAGAVGGADRVLRGAGRAGQAERGRADAGGGRVHAVDDGGQERGAGRDAGGDGVLAAHARQRAAGVPRAGAHCAGGAQRVLGAGGAPGGGGGGGARRRGGGGRVDQRAGGGGVREHLRALRALPQVEGAAAGAGPLRSGGRRRAGAGARGRRDAAQERVRAAAARERAAGAPPGRRPRRRGRRAAQRPSSAASG
ncbi:proline-rich receptor-like protein kinase PERK2 [Gracilaria domingensis]|nr:proline-rich receptor-like protein kinase PERK2 [Gracilaria domingensis]